VLTLTVYRLPSAALAGRSANVPARRNREAASLAAATDAFFDADVVLVPPDREQVAIAAEMVAHGLSTADAAYAARARPWLQARDGGQAAGGAGSGAARL